MVFGVMLTEESRKRLREWRGRVGFISLGNMDWYLFLADAAIPVIGYKKRVEIYVLMDFAAKAVEVIHYACSANFSLKVSTQQVEEYYDYDTWCWESALLPDNTCTTDNMYSFHTHNNLSLERPKSLSTIVPTQMSSLI